MEQQTKRCWDCKQDRLLSDFWKNRQSRDGLNARCKHCYNAYQYASGRAKRENQKLRLRVLRYYTDSGEPHCECCGADQLEFLALDHINGGGKKHHTASSGGRTYWLWFSQNDFPPGFRVLCHNCNMAKGFYGYCPHANLVVA